MGEGNLARTLRAQESWYVIETGLPHCDFFTASARGDVIVTNPPYSLKAQWIARSYEFGKPFALLIPVETVGRQDVQALMQVHGAELLLLNRRVNFEMPRMGYSGHGAQFPVLWFCWHLLPAPICFGAINYHAYPWEHDLATALAAKPTDRAKGQPAH